MVKLFCTSTWSCNTHCKLAGAMAPLLLSCCVVAAILLTASAAIKDRISEERGSWLAKWAASEGRVLVGEPGIARPRLKYRCYSHVHKSNRIFHLHVHA